MLRWQGAQKLLSVWWNQATGDPLVFFAGLGNSAAFSPKIIGFYPHVLAAEVLGEEGLLGTLLYLGILACFVLRFKEGLRVARIGTHSRNVVVTAAGIFLFAFLLSFKQGSLVGFTANLFLPLLLLEQHVRIAKAAAARESAAVALKPRTESRVSGIPKFPNLMS